MATPDRIPQSTLDEVTRGHDQPGGSIADQVCHRRTDVDAIEGTAPFLENEATVRRGLNRDLAPLEDPKPERGGMGEISYLCKRQVGMAEIADETDVQMSSYDIDAVDHWVAEAEKDADTAVDLKFAEVIVDTIENLEFNATADGNGAWDDPENGTPLQDCVDMSDEVPHATDVIAGREVVSALRKHPETAGEIFNYSGGGVVTTGHIRNLLADIFDVDAENVYLLTDRTFNEADLGEDYSLGFIAGQAFWAGAGWDLQLFDPNHPKNRNTEHERKQAVGDVITHVRMIDIKRNIQENAITATNLFS